MKIIISKLLRGNYSSKPIGSRQNFSIERFHSRAPFLLQIPVNAEKAFEIREESISKRPLCSQERRNDRWARDAAAARGAARPWNAKLNGASRPKYEIPRPCHTHTHARDTYLYCRRATIHEPWRKRVYLFLCDARRAQKGHNGPQIGVHNEVSREGSGAGEVDTTGRGGGRPPLVEDASAPLCCPGALPETINPR